MRSKQEEIFEACYKRLYVYSAKYITREGAYNDEVASDCTVDCFNALFALQEPPVNDAMGFLYKAARDFCSAYLVDTYGSDPTTDEQNSIYFVDVEFLWRLYQEGYTPENIHTLWKVKND